MCHGHGNAGLPLGCMGVNILVLLRSGKKAVLPEPAIRGVGDVTHMPEAMPSRVADPVGSS